jgi:hypothetical protein
VFSLGVGVGVAVGPIGVGVFVAVGTAGVKVAVAVAGAGVGVNVAATGVLVLVGVAVGLGEEPQKMSVMVAAPEALSKLAFDIPYMASTVVRML